MSLDVIKKCIQRGKTYKNIKSNQNLIFIQNTYITYLYKKVNRNSSWVFNDDFILTLFFSSYISEIYRILICIIVVLIMYLGGSAVIRGMYLNQFYS